MDKNKNKEKKEMPGLQKELDKSQNIKPGEHWTRKISAMLLALATICTAWSAYQAARWSGLQARYVGESFSAQLEISRLTNISSRKITIDVDLFVNYLNALNEKNQQFAEFLRQKFRPELQKATEAWLAMNPLQNPNAPASPFDLEIYSLPEERQIQALNKTAAESLTGSRQARQTGDNYILLTVLFASVLFFAGVGSKYRTKYLKLLMFMIGVTVFLVAVLLLIFYPKY